MRKLSLLLVCLLGCILVIQAQKTMVTGTLAELPKEKRLSVSLQQIGVWGRPLVMGEVGENRKFRLETELPSSGFYRLYVVDQSYAVYLNPGDELNLEIGGLTAQVSGKGWIVENQLLADVQQYQDEYFRLPVPVRTSFCRERAEGAWKAYQSKLKALKMADVRPEFKEKYKGFAGVEYWQVMIGGLGAQKDNVMSADYRKAVKRVKLSGAMLNNGQWHEILDIWLLFNMQENNLRLTGYENWMKDIALFIKDKELREAYLVRQIGLEVLRGEFVALPGVVRQVNKMIRQPENQLKVKEQLELMEKNYSCYSACMPGTDLSAFEFLNREGKKVKLGDLKGKYVYIDVWSTGCLPCKQEIPHLEELEKAMEDENIVFVSISLDTQEEVWQKFIREKNLGGLQLIAEKGFKHPLCATMGMRGIPRFILLDRECKVINFNAKRPSNPVLWKYLEDIVKDNEG